MSHTSLPKIYIAPSQMPDAGRGVFAGAAIKKGEMIERCPVIEIPSFDEERLNQTTLINYIYYLGKNKNHLTIVLGYGSIYNHTYQPNARYHAVLGESVVEFIALKDIVKGQEITVNYNQDVKTNNPLWFEV